MSEREAKKVVNEVQRGDQGTSALKASCEEGDAQGIAASDVSYITWKMLERRHLLRYLLIYIFTAYSSLPHVYVRAYVASLRAQSQTPSFR